VIRDRSEELHAFYARHFAEQVSERPASTNGHRSEVTGEEVIELVRSAKNAAKFEALWSGAVSGYASHSEADLALIGLLARHTRDENQLDRLYRQSGLYRPKWDERHYDDGRTYGQATIEKALEGAIEFYTTTDD
jgi:putative DNA primase/helicase